ncbi:MAG: PEP-CTERM sorting domain-containing protein [Terriglobia bacterium]
MLAELGSTGSIANHPYAATFTPVATSAVPEPGTASLAMLGLLLVAGTGLRRFSHC